MDRRETTLFIDQKKYQARKYFKPMQQEDSVDLLVCLLGTD